MGGLSDIGDIAGLVGSIVGMAIAAIVLLTFAPIIAGDINAIALQSTGHCVLSNGELVDRLVEASNNADTANEAWAENGGSNFKVASGTSDNCAAVGSIPENTVHYTPKGSKFLHSSSVGRGDDLDVSIFGSSEWKTASKSLTSPGRWFAGVFALRRNGHPSARWGLGIPGILRGDHRKAADWRRHPRRGHWGNRRGGNHRFDSAFDFCPAGRPVHRPRREPLLHLLPGHRTTRFGVGELPGASPS